MAGETTNFSVPDWARKAAPSIFGAVSSPEGDVQLPTDAVRAVSPALAASTYKPTEEEKTNAVFAADQKTPEVIDVPWHSGAPGNEAPLEDRGEGQIEGLGARGGVFARAFGGTGLARAVMPEGENYLPVGGKEGKNLFLDSFVTRPAEIARAVDAGAQAQEDEAGQVQNFYTKEMERQGNENAALKDQFLVRQQEQQARLDELEKQTRFYTNDLADSGRFWKNPQNIVAAIGAALMNLATDDRTLGPKLLNNAINRDLMERRQLADMHLGSMRSNLSVYDKIAGDKVSGDLLASAEAKRVAAMELDRIAAQFKGPKAKAQAAAIKGQLLAESQKQLMQFYAAKIYNAPQFVSPSIMSSYKAGGMELPGVGYTPFSTSSGAPAATPGGVTRSPLPAGSLGGVSSAASATGSTGDTTVLNNGLRVRITPFLSPQQRAEYDRRVPGIVSRLEAARKHAIDRIASTSRTPQEFSSKMEEFERYVENGIPDIAKATAPTAVKRAGYQAISQDMRDIEASLEGTGMSPQQFLGSAYVFAPETVSKISNIYDALIKKNPDEANKYELRKQLLFEKAQRFHQLLAGNINTYFHEKAGTAVNATEMDRIKQYTGNNSSWSRIKNFVENEANQAGREFDNQIQTSNNPIAAMLFELQMGVGRPTGLASKGIPRHEEGSAMPGPTDKTPGRKGVSPDVMKKAAAKLKGK